MIKSIPCSILNKFHDDNSRLIFLKSLHTIIWVIMASSNFLAFYLALINQFDFWFYLAVVLLVIETIVIVFNKWKCPVTKIAEKYTTNRKANFDIYLPELFAKYNVRIFSVLIVLEILIVFMVNI